MFLKVTVQGTKAAFVVLNEAHLRKQKGEKIVANRLYQCYLNRKLFCILTLRFKGLTANTLD